MKEKRYTLQEKQPIPIGWHPANEEEAVARIEAIEEEYENGQYIDADDFEKELTAQYPWLEDWKRSISIEEMCIRDRTIASNCILQTAWL